MAAKKKSDQAGMIRLSNKERRLLEYLEKKGSITTGDARPLLGDGRVSDTIMKLRRKGFQIDTLRIDTVNRYGESTWYGKYVFKGAKK